MVAVVVMSAGYFDNGGVFGKTPGLEVWMIVDMQPRRDVFAAAHLVRPLRTKSLGLSWCFVAHDTS